MMEGDGSFVAIRLFNFNSAMSAISVYEGKKVVALPRELMHVDI